MNLDISRYSKAIVTLLILAAIAKALSLGSIYFLKNRGISQVVDSSYTMPYKGYRFSKSFGIIEPAAIKSPEQLKANQPIYNLSSLELKAIYKTSKGGFIVALDNKKAKKSVFIKVNSEYNGYTLKELTNEKATFDRNGQKYKIEFKKKKSSALITPPSRPKTATRSDDIIRAVSKTEVHKYTKDFKSIWKSISIKEVKENDKIIGFKVNSIKEGTIFYKLGLKKGDIITAVNNKPMKSYASAFKIYKGVKTMTSLKITVTRNNQTKDLEYEIY